MYKFLQKTFKKKFNFIKYQIVKKFKINKTFDKI